MSIEPEGAEDRLARWIRAAMEGMRDRDPGVTHWDVTRIGLIDALPEVVTTRGLADQADLADSLLALLPPSRW